MMVSIMRMPGGAYALERGEPAEGVTGAAGNPAGAKGYVIVDDLKRGAQDRAAGRPEVPGYKRVRYAAAGAAETATIT